MGVEYAITGEVAQITSDRPTEMNTIDGETTTQLRAAFDRFEGDPGAQVAILTGTGRASCAGMDLETFAAGERPAVLEGPGHFGGFGARQPTKPVVAAVNGPGLAGGLYIEWGAFGPPELIPRFEDRDQLTGRMGPRLRELLAGQT